MKRSLSHPSAPDTDSASPEVVSQPTSPSDRSRELVDTLLGLVADLDLAEAERYRVHVVPVEETQGRRGERERSTPASKPLREALKYLVEYTLKKESRLMDMYRLGMHLLAVAILQRPGIDEDTVVGTLKLMGALTATTDLPRLSCAANAGFHTVTLAVAGSNAWRYRPSVDNEAVVILGQMSRLGGLFDEKTSQSTLEAVGRIIHENNSDDDCDFCSLAYEVHSVAWNAALLLKRHAGADVDSMPQCDPIKHVRVLLEEGADAHAQRRAVLFLVKALNYVHFERVVLDFCTSVVTLCRDVITHEDCPPESQLEAMELIRSVTEDTHSNVQGIPVPGLDGDAVVTTILDLVERAADNWEELELPGMLRIYAKTVQPETALACVRWLVGVMSVPSPHRRYRSMLTLLALPDFMRIASPPCPPDGPYLIGEEVAALVTKEFIEGVLDYIKTSCFTWMGSSHTGGLAAACHVLAVVCRNRSNKDSDRVCALVGVCGVMDTCKSLASHHIDSANVVSPLLAPVAALASNGHWRQTTLVKQGAVPLLLLGMAKHASHTAEGERDSDTERLRRACVQTLANLGHSVETEVET
ncbi:hypothetical protein KIPB_000488 [Kipferlia bialata]|uniref:Armadillo-type fold n=1 Tax=Kipferlia bialata TaxID=797122 RepID=A0A9K3CQK7_9EUKA|nr:hypothetical protein KIPB_000488 [Kipferlia bialata]|eukprot:g488.t1